MPKIYTDAEKQEHKHILYEHGLEFFNEQGFKNINIDKLVSIIGVSKGYFYLLFNSKEEFFLESILWGMQKTHEKLINFKEKGTKPAQLLKVYLECIVESPHAQISDYVNAYNKIHPEFIENFLHLMEEHYRKTLIILEKDSSPENVHILGNLVSNIHFSKIINSNDKLAFPDTYKETMDLLLNAVSDFIKKLPSDKNSYKQLFEK